MALSIDSASVLRAIADHPKAFGPVQLDVREFVRKVLLKQVKARTTDLEALQLLHQAVGGHTIGIILDHLTAKDMSGLLKRADPHSLLLKADGDPQALRIHLLGLASGEGTASSAPEKPVKRTPRPKPKPEVSKIGSLLESKVHSGKPRTSRAKTSSSKT